MKRPTLSIFFLLLAASRLAAYDTPELTGSVRSLSQLVESSPALEDRLFVSANTLRLTSSQRIGSNISAEASLENIWLYTSPANTLPPSSDQANTAIDATTTWRDKKSWSSRLHLDRLYLRGRHGGLRWAAGRQPYGFGNIVLYSPLDIIAPFSPDAIDTEYRPGVDALRIDYATPRGDLLGAVSVFDDENKLNSYLGTVSFNFSGIDVLLLGGRLRERGMGGLGLAGNLGGLGVKGELAWYEGKDTGQPGGDLYDDFPMGAAELWYRFDNDLVLLVEYLHNGAGAERPEDYPLALQSAPVVEAFSSLLGQNYLLFAPSLELHPLLSVSVFGIWNLDDDSYLVRPQFAISLNDNLALDISHSLHQGDAPTEIPFADVFIPRSEFGTYGDSAAMYLRWYF